MGKYADSFPLISIITPVFNAANKLAENLETVRLQTYPRKEHIIIDGGSSDGTLEILQKNNAGIGYWISKPDAGIYDAMNKGIAAARGEWIYFLGVDDYFYGHDTLISVMKNDNITDDIELILGNVIFPDGRLMKSRLDGKIYYKNTVHHQGALYRRSVFNTFRYGRPLLNKTKHFRISGDYQLNLFLYKAGAKHIYVDEIIAKCGKGVSMEGRLTGYLEEIIIRHLYTNFLQAAFFDFLTLLRYGWKKIDFRNYR